MRNALSVFMVSDEAEQKQILLKQPELARQVELHLKGFGHIQIV